jgi:hypothetical protein
MLDSRLVEERRDLGLMLHHLDRNGEAVVQLRRYLDEHPKALDRPRIQTLIDTLEG